VWVINVISSERRPLPQFPRKPTFACAAISVATGQEQNSLGHSRPNDRRGACQAEQRARAKKFNAPIGSWGGCGFSSNINGGTFLILEQAALGAKLV